MAEIALLIVIPLLLLLLIATVLVHIFFMIPYVPTKKRVVENMIALAKVKKNEVVFDLGCGDGRLLLEAEKKYCARGVGFEIAPLVYALARFKRFVGGGTFALKFESLFNAKLKNADVIVCYLIPSAMEKISKKIKRECKKGTRIVTNTFKLPGFTPRKILKRPGLPSLFLYHV